METTRYTPSQLARLSGVSVRTLHHYDHIGLLVPARTTNGYRSYSPTDVARLQQILLMRDMGMDLANIAQMLDDPAYDQVASLRRHLKSLRERRAQIDVLIATVEKTIDSLEGDKTMTDKERFEGLKREAIEQNERTYGVEARERFGDNVIDAANERLLVLDETAWNDLSKLEAAIKEQLRLALATGDASGAEADALVRMHARWVSAHWPEGSFSLEAYRGLADGYLADQRFIAYYDQSCGDGATQFLHDAIHALA